METSYQLDFKLSRLEKIIEYICKTEVNDILKKNPTYLPRISDILSTNSIHLTWSFFQDAVGMITQSKLRSNPESNVGLLTLGGLEVLTTLTTDSGKILAKLTGGLANY